MAADGLRVLGVAAATQKDSSFPASQTEFAFRFLGLVGLADPLRQGVPDAVRDCRSTGIRVVMITVRLSGDRAGDRPTGRHRKVGRPHRR